MLVVGKSHPRAPCVIHTTSYYSVLVARSDHGGLSDGYMHIFSKLLAEFLIPNVDSKSAAGVDWFVECVEVSVNLGLGYCCVVSHHVVIDVADADPVEALVGFLEFDELPLVERGGPNVDGNATCVDIFDPVFVQ